MLQSVLWVPLETRDLWPAGPGHSGGQPRSLSSTQMCPLYLASFFPELSQLQLCIRTKLFCLLSRGQELLVNLIHSSLLFLLSCCSAAWSRSVCILTATKCLNFETEWTSQAVLPDNWQQYFCHMSHKKGTLNFHFFTAIVNFSFIITLVNSSPSNRKNRLL